MKQSKDIGMTLMGLMLICMGAAVPVLAIAALVHHLFW